jgi:murein biosynthesis integral membrane protein MurJ
MPTTSNGSSIVFVIISAQGPDTVTAGAAVHQLRLHASLALIVVASFVLGFARDVLIAGRFGAGVQADILFVALVVPVFFENLLGIALRDALIPHLQKLKQGAADSLAAIKASLYRRTTYIGIALALGIYLLAAPLLAFVAPGWDTAMRTESLSAFELGALLVLLNALLYCQTAFLNVEGVFLVPMTRSLFFNLGALVVLLFWPQGATQVIGGMVIGLATILLIQHRLVAPGLRHCAIAGSMHNEPFARDFILVLAATAFQQACVIAERLFASLLDTGSITMLSLAFRVTTIPLVLFSLSILTVLYPHLARSWAAGEHDAFAQRAAAGIKLTLAILLPAALFFVLEPTGTIEVLFERGRFAAEQTALTSPLLLAYALGLPAMGLALLLGRTLLAQRQHRVFLIVMAASSSLTTLLDALLYRPFGAAGLAAAFAAGAWLQAAWLWWHVQRVAPVAFGLADLARWSAAALLSWLVLQFLPAAESIAGLIATASAALISVGLLLWLLGERDLFRRSFWVLPT